LQDEEKIETEPDKNYKDRPHIGGLFFVILCIFHYFYFLS
jgi:hypothetical protein